jgi:uncharacterized SAM-binding protein YcdF (DUF218 family)
MVEKYDLCVVLGLRFGGRWGLRSDLKQMLNKAADLYRTGSIKTIVVSGRWTIWYDWLHIKPPVTEAMLMKRYLQKQGVPKDSIICESYSKDTVGNAYFVKVLTKKHPTFKRILVICALQRERRARFLFHKFFGDDYSVSFYPVYAQHDAQSSLGNEEKLLEEDKKLLEHVRAGHEEDIKQQLYSLPHYRKQAIAIESHPYLHRAKLGRTTTN